MVKKNRSNQFQVLREDLEQHFDKRFQETRENLEQHLDKRFQETEERLEDRFQRHVGVLMEEMRSTVQLVTEQHSSMVERMDRLEAQYRDFKMSQESFQRQLAHLLGDHEIRLGGHDNRIREIEIKLGLN